MEIFVRIGKKTSRAIVGGSRADCAEAAELLMMELYRICKKLGLPASVVHQRPADETH
jgi:hypothetical protein